MMDRLEGRYSGYIVQELFDPGLGSPEFQSMYRKFARRVLWMDSGVVPGAFQMNTAWYFKVPEKDPVFEEHVHDFDEIIGFFGSDPEDPYNLHAELEVGIGGETYTLTRTSMIFVPGGLRHMPLWIKRIDRPIFHFSVVMNQRYEGDGVYK